MAPPYSAALTAITGPRNEGNLPGRGPALAEAGADAALSARIGDVLEETAQVGLALSDSAGFGGHNTVLALRPPEAGVTVPF